MTYLELLEVLAEKTYLTKDAARGILSALSDVIVECAHRHEPLAIKGLGTFTPYYPRGGLTKELKLAVRFRTASTLRTRLKEKTDMDKYGVTVDEKLVDKLTKEASEGPGCPNCGAKVLTNTNVPTCPNCGTKPFEQSQTAGFDTLYGKKGT